MGSSHGMSPKDEMILHNHIDCFASEMKEKVSKELAKGKTGWRTMDERELFDLLIGETDELDEALGCDYGPGAVMGECVDVALFSLFIWAEGKAKEEDDHESTT